MDALHPDRWPQVSRLLDEAMDLEGDARAAWIDDLRRRDQALADVVSTLLDEQSALVAEHFLEPPSTPASLEGTVVGRYRLLSPLGQGGMGTVWLAERADGRYDGRAAVKLLNVSRLNRTGEERFAREGRILSRLDHPHVARLIDAGVAPSGQPYLVLEYVEGEHIDRYCDRHDLDVEARLALFLDVLDAVTHAHRNLVVHRDIKPSNVLVSAEGHVKLLDFGIAKLLDPADSGETPALTAEGAQVLTPEYASPEQLTGGPVTVATDVYALGVLLYVLLGGRHPAGDTDTPAALFKAIVDTDPPPPSTVASAPTFRRVLRGDLDTIVGKALRKAPDDRYVSADAFAQDIRRYLAREPVSARPQTWRYRTSRFVRRHASGVAAGVAVLLVLASVVSFYTVQVQRERDRARVEADKAVQVSELLADLLTAADPYARRDNREPTVRSVLDAGADRVGRDLSAQPAVRADLLVLMGRAYDRLGVSDRAIALLTEALPLTRDAYGGDHIRVSQALNDLGTAYRRAGDTTAAALLLDEALALRRRLLGTAHPDLAVTLIERARVHLDAGERAEAEPLIRESLSIRRATLGDAHAMTSTSLSELGLLLWSSGDAASAEPLFRESLAISREAFGNDHPNVSSGLNNLALTLGAQGDWAGAEAAQRESVEIGRRTLGADHREMGPKLANLAVTLIEQGRFDQASAILEEAVTLVSTALGADHPSLVGYRFFQARVRLGQGRAVDAEAMLRGVLAAREAAGPAGNWRIGQARSALGEALAMQGRYDEAESMLTAALETLRPGADQQGREHALALARRSAASDARHRQLAGPAPSVRR